MTYPSATKTSPFFPNPRAAGRLNESGDVSSLHALLADCEENLAVHVEFMNHAVVRIHCPQVPVTIKKAAWASLNRPCSPPAFKRSVRGKRPAVGSLAHHDDDLALTIGGYPSRDAPTASCRATGPILFMLTYLSNRLELSERSGGQQARENHNARGSCHFINSPVGSISSGDSDHPPRPSRRCLPFRQRPCRVNNPAAHYGQQGFQSADLVHRDRHVILR